MVKKLDAKKVDFKANSNVGSSFIADSE